MKKTILILAVNLLCNIIYAQNRTIKGSVAMTDKGGYNLLLFTKSDSAFYKGDFFPTETFEIEVEEIKLPLIMKISSLGYKDTVLHMDKNSREFPDIRLDIDSKLLSEVVISTKTPAYTLKNDRVTMNVKNTVLSQAGTAVDILQKAARVKVDNSGISVLGIGQAMVVVDGKVLASTQMLESIASTDIEKIDIITNPSAKYDASGKAVIEITLKKVRNEGWGADINARLGKGEAWRKYSGAEFSAGMNKLSLFTSYFYAPSKHKNKETYEYGSNLSNDYFIINNRQTELNHKNNHNARLALDYNFSSEHTAGIQLNASIRNTCKDIYNSNHVNKKDKLSVFESLQNGTLTTGFISGTAYYSYIPKSKNSSFTIFYDKSNFNNKDNTDIKENNSIKANHIKTNITVDALQMDWQIKNQHDWIFNAGSKISHVFNSGKTQFVNSSEKNILIDYKYSENIYALYTLLSGQISKFSLEGGIRIEALNNRAMSNGEEIKKEKLKLDIFPHLSVNYKINDIWNLSAGYAMKINRPAFQDMNPAINYIDSLTYFQGNPNLTAEKQHSLHFNIFYKSYASIDFNCAHRKNMLAWYLEQDDINPAVSKATQKNIDKSDTYSCNLFIPYRNKRIASSLSTGLIFAKSNDAATEVIDLHRHMWYIYTDFNIDLAYGFKLGSNIRYYTKGVENIFYFDPVFRMDMNLQRNFLNNKLTASLLWNDLFSSDGMNTYATLNDRHIRYNYYFDRSSIQLSLTYHFKPSKIKYKSKSTIEDEKSRIKNMQQ